MNSGNLFSGIPTGALPDELLQILWQSPRVRIERLVSRGHATPAGQWYDQDSDEWVVLLSGSARLHIEGTDIEGTDDVVEMRPGDYVLLPAHLRHRVEWTEPHRDTVWLAIHVHAE